MHGYGDDIIAHFCHQCWNQYIPGLLAIQKINYHVYNFKRKKGYKNEN